MNFSDYINENYEYGQLTFKAQKALRDLDVVFFDLIENGSEMDSKELKKQSSKILKDIKNLLQKSTGLKI